MFVNENRDRYEGKSRRIIRIDQRRKRDSKPLVIQLGRRDSFGVQGDADHGEAHLPVLLEFLLPHGQIVSAESPTGPAVNNVLLAEKLREPHFLVVQVVKRNIGQRLAGAEPATLSPGGVVGRKESIFVCGCVLGPDEQLKLSVCLARAGGGVCLAPTASVDAALSGIR